MGVPARAPDSRDMPPVEDELRSPELQRRDRVPVAARDGA
jgi:hypothetical protein